MSEIPDLEAIRQPRRSKHKPSQLCDCRPDLQPHHCAADEDDYRRTISALRAALREARDYVVDIIALAEFAKKSNHADPARAVQTRIDALLAEQEPQK